MFAGIRGSILHGAKNRIDRGLKQKVWRQATGILFGGAILALVITLLDQGVGKQELTEVERKTGMDDSYEIILEAEREDGTEKEVTLTIPAMEYDEATIRTWFDDGKETIVKQILAENSSLDHVDSKLNLMTQMPGTAVAVTWATSDNLILDWEGNIGSEVKESGSQVTLYVTFQCQDIIEEFELAVTVFPDKYQTTAWEQKLKHHFTEINQESSGKIYLLPKEVDGEQIVWSSPKNNLGLIIIFCAVMAALGLVLGKKEEDHKEKEKKKEQMLLDYPEILNKFTLLLNAGLNTRKAFAKVALDYRKTGGEPRAAYEAIAAAYVEMEQGVPEVDVYERLGERCELAVYKTFTTLLVQNLRKGNRELLEIMEREAILAFEERKRRAKVLGEKAGTKLLVPMMGMLLIVFVVLLFPAWMNFSM